MQTPLKTGDIIKHGDKPMLVRAVKMTLEGPIIEALPVLAEKHTLHISEVELYDWRENNARIKAIGTSVSNNTMELPIGMTPELAQKILNDYIKNNL